MKDLPFVVLLRFAKTIVIGCFFLQGAISSAQDVVTIPEDRENFHIYLLMGQSNMAGGASVDGPMDTETNARILKLGNLGWELAKDPISNYYDVAVGPGFQFAKTMVAENPDITIGLIPLAVGGTPISFWSKPSLKYFESVYAANEARQFGTLKGILWHQGESDSTRIRHADPYEKNLLTLIDDLRKDLQDPYIPFIVGGLTESEEMLATTPLRSVVGDSLKTIRTTFLKTGYVSSKDVPFLTDNQIHFTSEGQRLMGERYAVEALRVHGYWTAKGKEWLDSEVMTVEVDDSELDGTSAFGWKYHPELGIYYDEHWPVIKHAQLGWLKIEIDENQVIHLDSPFLGTFLVMRNPSIEHAIYIFPENRSDPDNPVYGTPFYVDVTREPGDPYCFADHSYEPAVFIDRLPGMTVIEDSWDINSMLEAEYFEAQMAAQLLRNEIAADGYWSTMRKFVDEVVYHRNYTNYLGWEGYHWAVDNETRFKEFWKSKFYERMLGIDEYVRQAQTDFQGASDVLLSQ